MDIGYLANLAEILGGLAVIGSLLYVGVQIRHNTKATQTTATHNLTNTFLSLTQTICEDPEMARIWVQQSHDASALTSSDLARLVPLNIMVLRTFEDVFHHHQMGQMDDEIWQGWRSFILTICSYPGIRDLWEHRKCFYSPSFQAFIDDSPEIERILPVKKYIDLVSMRDETWFVAAAVPLFMALGIIASLYFMWSTRHPRVEWPVGTTETESGLKSHLKAEVWSTLE